MPIAQGHASKAAPRRGPAQSLHHYAESSMRRFRALQTSNPRIVQKQPRRASCATN